MAARAKRDGVVRQHPFQFVERQAIRARISNPGRGQRLRQAGVIEGRLSRALFGIDQNELTGVGSGLDLIPELRVAFEPMRLDPVAIDFALGQFAQMAGAFVIRARPLGGQPTSTQPTGRHHQQHLTDEGASGSQAGSGFR